MAVTNRIRDLSARTIGKEVTAHLIRHYRGTVLSEKFDIKAASELGRLKGIFPASHKCFLRDESEQEDNPGSAILRPG